MSMMGRWRARDPHFVGLGGNGENLELKSPHLPIYLKNGDRYLSMVGLHCLIWKRNDTINKVSNINS
ncbi:MAG: hypothetical protein C4322_17365 [Mastigocladus sp. ERB_26_1]